MLMLSATTMTVVPMILATLPLEVACGLLLIAVMEAFVPMTAVLMDSVFTMRLFVTTMMPVPLSIAAL